MTNIVSGAVSTVSELGKDEAWLQGWLKEQPSRLGLGDLEVGEAATDEAFVATADDRCFSVDVHLGELEASRGFQVLDNWARNRVMHPDKTHVAVLVTEALGDRYQTTLETLAEHLPLVVVELAVWKGENEAIVVPHVALSSDDVDLADTPAAKAAEAVAKTAETETAAKADADETPETEVAEVTDEADGEAEVVSEAEAVAAEAEAQADADTEGETDGEGEGETDGEGEGETHEDKDDTGVGNPWGFKESGAGSTGLLSKVGR